MVTEQLKETMMADHTEMQIPDDVMEAALKAAYKTAHFGGVRGEMTSYGLEAVVNAIATEVAKERERCARIAIRQAPATQDFADAPLQELATRIASKILSVDK